VDEFIAYETNVTNVPDILTNYFRLNFADQTSVLCYFKKAGERPLLLACSSILTEGDYYLGEIKEEINIENIHALYNFTILPVINNDIFTIENEGTHIFITYPSEELDFNGKDELIIYLITYFQ